MGNWRRQTAGGSCENCDYGRLQPRRVSFLFVFLSECQRAQQQSKLLLMHFPGLESNLEIHWHSPSSSNVADRRDCPINHEHATLTLRPQTRNKRTKK